MLKPKPDVRYSADPSQDQQHCNERILESAKKLNNRWQASLLRNLIGAVFCQPFDRISGNQAVAVAFDVFEGVIQPILGFTDRLHRQLAFVFSARLESRLEDGGIHWMNLLPQAPRPCASRHGLRRLGSWSAEGIMKPMHLHDARHSDRA